MSEVKATLIRNPKGWLLLCFMLGLALLLPSSGFADKKKKDAPAKIPVIDYSNIVWPNPPAVARIRFQSWYSAEKISQAEEGTHTQKAKWMDRLAGTQSQAESGKVLWQLAEPYGVAVDSKGNLYIADQKVGAIFIFNTETRDLDMIKNKTQAHFVRIIGLAMDDGDRLFVSDPGLRHVLVFDSTHKVTDVISDGMAEPSMLAIDKENRQLYVSDIELDQVLVYDADTLKLKRKTGTTRHHHELTTPGDFAKPTGVAVDQEGNLYVCDTLNDRIEIFDADGKYLSTFGKAGDGPGYFARPKGVAIDSDNHIWVTDGQQDRVQVFNQEFNLLITFGGHGMLPGMFQGLAGITIDKDNRVFTSEIYPGRVQQFRYVTDAEAEKLANEKELKRAGSAPKQIVPVAAPTPAASAPQSH